MLFIWNAQRKSEHDSNNVFHTEGPRVRAILEVNVQFFVLLFQAQSEDL